MNTPKVSFLILQYQFNTDEDFFLHLNKLKWLSGFQFPHCDHNKETALTEVVIAILNVHHFWLALLYCIYPALKCLFIGLEKGSISVLRLN